MGYSNFRTIEKFVEKFNFEMRYVSLFGDSDIQNVNPSAWLIETLNRAKTFPLRNEKAKAERVISPILLEAVQDYADRVSFFSGEQINIKPEDDLSGECDFFFALQPPRPYLDAPIISLAEAKDEDMDWGIAQCAAQMLGAKYFNEKRGRNVPFIYGCATDGVEWQFMKLENDIYYLDNKIYTDLKEILGVWHHVINLYL
jgi:hypothetical protein